VASVRAIGLVIMKAPYSLEMMWPWLASAILFSREVLPAAAIGF